MGWWVALTDEAEADLGNLVAFLAQKSPPAAERIGLELVALIFSLDLVEIVRIWDGREDPQKLCLPPV